MGEELAPAGGTHGKLLPMGKDTREPTKGLPIPHTEKHLPVTSCEGRALRLWLLLPGEVPLGTVTPGLRRSQAIPFCFTLASLQPAKAKERYPPRVLDMFTDVPPPPPKPSIAPRRVSS